MAKIPLIHNPVSGSARGGALLRKAEALLASEGVHVEPVATRYAGHATELARSLGDGADLVLVLGGDGTLSEVANGVLALPPGRRPACGFLPGGTGNDFLRDFGIFAIEDAVRSIVAGRTVAFDAVDVRWPGGQHYSINVLGCGLAAKAGACFGKGLHWLGKKGYDVAVVIHIAKMRAYRTLMLLDGRKFCGDFPLVLACNSVHTGGGMPMAPQAKPTDGLLDVVYAQDIGKAEMLLLFATKLPKGEHVKSSKVHIERAAHVRIEPEEPSPLLLDGEIVGTTPADFQVMPGVLRLLA
jgi:YegS/Rv2252/BmrU family lipid kinase